MSERGSDREREKDRQCEKDGKRVREKRQKEQEKIELKGDFISSHMCTGVKSSWRKKSCRSEMHKSQQKSGSKRKEWMKERNTSKRK